MARSYTPQDAYALMNELVVEATGQDAIDVVDTSSFINAGESVLATGTENTLNALSMVILRTLVAARPYNGKLNIINSIDTGAYSNRLRKISFYSKAALPAGDWNTQLYTNLGDGFENTGAAAVSPALGRTGSQWEQHPPMPVEMNYGGSSVWQDAITRYEYQVKQAFRSESEFMAFVTGFMTEKANDIESQKEAFRRATMINYMGMLVDAGASTSLVNLTSAFNTRFGTSYTSAQLRTTYLKDFLAFFVSTVKTISNAMTNRSASYHIWPPKDGYSLLRHTPKDKQKIVLYQPLFTEAEALVLPQVFNDQYLKLANYEGVDYWQSILTPAAIKVKPSEYDTTTGKQVSASDAVALDYVVGMLFDTDALMVDYQLESVRATPVEARKGYSNIWYSFARNGINDPTENAVLFYMADPAPDPEDGGAVS